MDQWFDLRVDHLLTFDRSTFDLTEACAGLRLQTADERRALLSLVARE
ncbi:MAG TPA: hypothetical protein VEK07_23605 [Polyangiaceae bacterium]|nr:hypothetical protein [Polyangiaceae bacterium]